MSCDACQMVAAVLGFLTGFIPGLWALLVVLKECKQLRDDREKMRREISFSKRWKE